MPRRVHKGQPLEITAAEYNSMLDAAQAHAADRLKGGKHRPDPVYRSAGIIRAWNTSGDSVEIGGVLAIDSSIPDPDAEDANEFAAVRFARNYTARMIAPDVARHVGQIAITIEPIADDAVGYVCIDGIVAARVNVLETWHTFADMVDGSFVLRSLPTGTADILWRSDPTATGEQWAVVRIGNTFPNAFLIQPPETGIPGMLEDAPGAASDCPLYRLKPDGLIEAVTDDGDPVLVDVLNFAPDRTAPPLDMETDLRLIPVRYDSRIDRWMISPPRRVIVGKPVDRIRPGRRGLCLEQRFDGPSGAMFAGDYIFEVRNACAYVWEPDEDTVLAHWHDDAGYIGQSCKCCDGSEGSA